MGWAKAATQAGRGVAVDVGRGVWVGIVVGVGEGVGVNVIVATGVALAKRLPTAGMLFRPKTKKLPMATSTSPETRTPNGTSLFLDFGISV